jgi:hypothetical protein
VDIPLGCVSFRLIGLKLRTKVDKKYGRIKLLDEHSGVIVTQSKEELRNRKI